MHLRRQAPELLEDPNFEVYIDGGVTRGTEYVRLRLISRLESQD